MADIQDDGSLAFLNIPRDERSRSFNCEQTSQSKLVNTTIASTATVEHLIMWGTNFSAIKS